MTTAMEPEQNADPAKLMRMRELIDLLTLHNHNYYTLDQPTISDKEYDELYDELVALEQETGRRARRIRRPSGSAAIF